MRQTLLFPFFVSILAACSSALPVAPSVPSPQEEISGPKPSSAPAAAADTTRDPKIALLAKAAAACKFEDNAFDDECPAYKAWNDDEELFAEGKGNDTVFSMLADGDEKTRALAIAKGLDDAKLYFADKAHATKLFDLAKKETDDRIGNTLGGYVAKVDAESLGLGDQLRALAKHPSIEFRKSLAFYMISTYQTPAALDAERALLEDPEHRVKETAISALSTGGITPAGKEVCSMLAKQITRTDDLAGEALWAGSSSKCDGMAAQVIAELGKRTADPSKVTNKVGIGYTLAASGVCTRGAPVELKKKAYDIGKALVDAKIPDANTRRSAIDVLTSCDPAAADKALQALSKDKDKFVAEGAKKALDRLRQKKS